MFRFIHAADIHLDSPLRGLSAREGAPAELIRAASRRAFENLVQLCLDESVDFLLIAGDLYDGDWPDFSTGLFFNQQMRLLRDAGIPVYLISGNHDAQSKLTKSLNPPENVHLFSTKKAETKTLHGHPVSIHGQSFATPSVQENLALGYPEPVENTFNIGLLHCSVGDSPDHGTYAPCALTDLRDRQYNYWALGHIHIPQVISTAPHIVYSGNIQGRHARETGERGCYFVNVSDDLEITEHRFHALDEIRWEHIKVSLDDISEESAAIEKIRLSLSGVQSAASPRLVCVRLTITGVTSLHSDFHTDPAHWLAQLHDLTADLGGLWLEKLKLETRPPIDLETLASQSDLTAQILTALETAEFTDSDVIQKLKRKLPNLPEEELTPSRADVSALVLDALTRSSS